MNVSSENIEIQIIDNLAKTDIYIEYNNSRDTIVYVSIKNLYDSIPDSLYLYPIRGLFIEKSSIKYRKDFLKQLEILSIDETYFYGQLNIDSTFKYLKRLQIINPLSKTTNSNIQLDEFEYWIKLERFRDKDKFIPFSFDLNKMIINSSMYIISPLEEIIIPSNRKYRKIIYCTKNEQFERLKAEYEIVDTLYCHKMRERLIQKDSSSINLK